MPLMTKKALMVYTLKKPAWKTYTKNVGKIDSISDLISLLNRNKKLKLPNVWSELLTSKMS